MEHTNAAFKNFVMKYPLSFAVAETQAIVNRLAMRSAAIAVRQKLSPNVTDDALDSNPLRYSVTRFSKKFVNG